MRSGNGPLAFKNMGSSPATFDVKSLVPKTKEEIATVQKTTSYEDLKKEGGDVKAAKKWNTDKYGTENPTAEAKKAGISKSELSKRHKTPKVNKVEPEVKSKVEVKEEVKPKSTVRDNFGEGSEKTKRLKSELQTRDAKTTDAYVEKEMSEAHEGKYGKGLFGGAIRRKLAKGKHKRKGRQEDKTREKLAESEAYDKLTPEQKAQIKAGRKEKVSDAIGELSDRLDPDERGLYAKGKAAKSKSENQIISNEKDRVHTARTQQIITATNKSNKESEKLSETTKTAVTTKNTANVTTGAGENKSNKKSSVTSSKALANKNKKA